MHKDYYRILHVEEDATDAEIKTSYRRLARKYHPDVSSLKDAEERFKEIVEAYDMLRDPARRMSYDRLGYWARELRPAPDWERQFSEIFSGEVFCEDEAAAQCDLGDLFAMFKGGMTHGSDKRSFRRCSDGIEVTAHVTLEQAVRGAQVEVEVTEPLAGGCHARKTSTVCAQIPRGAKHGQQIRVPFQNGHGEARGDLHITIAVRPHPLFRVDGDDLMLDLPLTPWEAALGTTVEVPTLEGRVRLRIPAGTQPNRKLRLAGRGLPKPDGSSGDLYAVLQIVTPTELTDREKQLFAELARASSFEPRVHFA